VHREHLGAEPNVDQRAGFDPAHEVLGHRPSEPVAAHQVLHLARARGWAIRVRKSRTR
jgi:hypothetical protein